MKILFGTTNYGRDTSEVDSGYLVWIIEQYDKADWTLVNACKKELSARLNLSWEPKSDEQRDLETALKQSTKQADKLLSRIEWYRYIIQAHGINLNYFRRLGKLFAISLYFRTQSEGSLRLPDQFADNEAQKSPFNIFTVNKSDVA